MNKKGSIAIYGMMLGILIIILTLALAPSINSFVRTSMNASVGDTLGLDCSNESISNFDKAACVTTDLTLFYFVGTLLLIGGAVITAKIIF